ncbi:hypothetical protein Fmac_027178 [Flemingia macrophylla]|uniref:PGG domain-containing protein n=1 Tax=Flemingia macrophylla TaxID=520843 RepID=A0ABD1LGY8_9FABA
MSEEQKQDEGHVSTKEEVKGKGDEITSEKEEMISDRKLTEFRVLTLEGKWTQVIGLFNEDERFCTTKINESRGTALHVAVNEGKEKEVKDLVDAILKHKKEKETLECKDERGDTPLHLAAARGFKNICEFIVGTDHNKRKDLVKIHNNEGENPLFLAALSWHKQTFLYLSSLMPEEDVNYVKDLIRSNGDSILHCAIRREFFDLALIIMDKYRKLYDIQNREGFGPLKLLATRPTAFKSGISLIWWKKILYHCIYVENLDVNKAVEKYNRPDEADQKNYRFPQNHVTCYQLVSLFRKFIIELLLELRDIAREGVKFCFGSKGVKQEDQGKHQCQIFMPAEGGDELVPPNCFTCLQFVRFAYIYTLGLCGAGVEDIEKMKQKHTWSRQLLKEFLTTPYETYMGSGGLPSLEESNFESDDIFPSLKEGLPHKFADIDRNQKSIEEDCKSKIKVLATENGLNRVSIEENYKSKMKTPLEEYIDQRKKTMADREETVILVAARNGIVEMVEQIIDKIPSSIHETNSKKKNVLLVAVENRQTRVVEGLGKLFRENPKLFYNLIIGVDDQENTVLHLAACYNKGWMIAGAALQMMWQIKWFQYIKELVPEHFKVRTNREEITAGEIFRLSHTNLVKDASEWLKDTSESCSVVAALLAGVSFATSTTVPGGNTDSGKPALEGRPAFEAFAIFSLMGLCFSVTALIMFLSILTSRKEIKDFKTNLPVKVLFGLSSLFLSISAMFGTFCSGHFFVIGDKYKQILILLYATTCMPVTFYAIAQLPLYVDLVRAITTKVPLPSDKCTDDL